MQIRRREPGARGLDPAADRGYESVLDRGVDFSAVLADSLGRSPELLLEPPEWDRPARNLEERVWRALHEVADPEFPISLVDLGLVYGIAVEPAAALATSREEAGEPGMSGTAPDDAGARVTVTISLTATACPCQEFIKWDIRERLFQEPGVTEVRVEITWDPPWTTARITERGREALRRAGVAI